MTNKSGRARRRTNSVMDELIWGELCQVTKISVSLRQQNDIALRDIFNKKRKCCNNLCTDFVYFNTLLLIILYMSAIETLIFRREMSLIGFTSFGFCTKYDT